MKVVHIITRLILGGAQENTLITCSLLARRGHDVTLITGPAIGPEGQLFDQTAGQPYRVVVLDRLRRAINPINDISSYLKLKKLLAELAPDVVHTHSAKAGVLGRLAAHELKAKSGRSRPAVVHTVHGLAFHPYQSSVLNRFYIAIEKFAAARTDAFISVAEAMTRQSLAAGIGTPDQFTTAYSAIEQQAFLEPLSRRRRLEFRRKHGIPGDAIVLVTIARLFELKGHDYIIASARKLAKRFDNCIWLFVGDGNLWRHYKRQVRRLGLAERFRFTGLLPPSDIPLAIQSSDILVHCSLREGLARALPQAMLCGRPAVSFDLDGAAEVVNENTGRLIEPRNIEQLVTACAELIENEPLRHQLGQQARESVRAKFDPETMVDIIEFEYYVVAGKRP